MASEPTVVTALIVVDVQNDFCEGGSLAVEGGAACAAAITRHVADHAGRYAAIYGSMDWHVSPGAHFASHDGTEPDFVDTWPDHCVAGTDGAALHDALDVTFDAIVRKGRDAAAYSAFEGIDDDGLGLGELLIRDEITDVEVCGIATSHCVRATALDALAAGFPVRVLTDLTVGVADDLRDAALAELVTAGATLVSGADV